MVLTLIACRKTPNQEAPAPNRSGSAPRAMTVSRQQGLDRRQAFAHDMELKRRLLRCSATKEALGRQPLGPATVSATAAGHEVCTPIWNRTGTEAHIGPLHVDDQVLVLRTITDRRGMSFDGGPFCCSRCNAPAHRPYRFVSRRLPPPGWAGRRAGFGDRDRSPGYL